MTNPSLPGTDPLHGSFVLAVRNPGKGVLTNLKGWPGGRWWNSALLFWDDCSSDGQLGPEEPNASLVGALCLSREIRPGASGVFEFLLAWHFPNRTPARCGWTAPKGAGDTVIGNWYCTQFADAWKAAQFASDRLDELERKTRLFSTALRESTLPVTVLEAASANLSTLATTTCFRIRANGDQPDPQGDLIAESATEHQLGINLRTLGDAAASREIFGRAFSRLPVPCKSATSGPSIRRRRDLNTALQVWWNYKWKVLHDLGPYSVRRRPRPPDQAESPQNQCLRGSRKTSR